VGAMAQLLVLYNPPANPAAFQTYYRDTHAPLVKKIPGLRSLTISDGPVQSPSGNTTYFVANLSFHSMAGLQTAMASPEGQAAAADVPKFAPGKRDVAGLRQQDRVSLDHVPLFRIN
jgi:uncharacterized protein (TIGR02118 family)